ncbi:MAG: LysR family transcriptional regulator [Bacteroidales bacterium]|nr:LysR family transcriptional regulator [Bacteroidales bacterium]
MMDFRLKVFLSVAHNQSFTKASKELFITQPAISKHIQELEATYQVRLFDRGRKEVSLTTAGKILYRYATEVVSLYKKIEYEMGLLHEDLVGELRLGASTTIAQYILPPILARFINQFPSVKLTLISGNSHEIESLLLKKQIDLGLIEGSHRSSEFKYVSFMKDELVIVKSKPRGKSQIENLSIEDFKQAPLVLRERGSGTLEVLEKALDRHHIKLSDLNVMMHLGSTESIKLFLQETDALAVVSVRSIYKELYAGTFYVIDIEDLSMERDFCFVLPHGAEEGVLKKFMDYVLYNEKL